MKTLLKYSIALSLVIIAFQCSYGQVYENRYAVETTLNSKTPIAYENLYGAMNLNSNSGDLSFTTNLADLKTGDHKTDSLTNEQERIGLTFKANLGTNYFSLVREENDDTYHKIIGTITINSETITVNAYVKIENLSDKSNLSKSIIDLRFELDPKAINIPLLSSYFNNVLLFQIDDSIINQNG